MSGLTIRYRALWRVTGACLAVAACSVLVAAAFAAKPRSDLVGKWSCCGSGGAGGQVWKISSMSASSGSFKGSGGGGGDTFPITGRLSGRSVKVLTGPYRQLPAYSATFTGTVSASGKSMSGTWKSTAGQSGKWSAKLTTALKKFKKKGKKGKGKKGKKGKK